MKIAKAVKKHKRAQWLKENAAAMDSSNAYVKANGLPLARYRQADDDGILQIRLDDEENC